jgi:hypothetical protein
VTRDSSLLVSNEHFIKSLSAVTFLKLQELMNPCRRNFLRNKKDNPLTFPEEPAEFFPEMLYPFMGGGKLAQVFV